MKKWYTRMSAIMLSAALMISSLSPLSAQAGYGNSHTPVVKIESGQTEGKESLQVAEINGVTYAALQDAIDSVANGESATVTILDDIEVAEPIQITGAKSITLTVPKDESHVIRRATEYRGSLFGISGNSTLAVGTQTEEAGGVLTLDGGAKWEKIAANTAEGEPIYMEAKGPADTDVINTGLTADKALIELTAGYFYLYANAVLQNNDNQTTTGAGAVYSPSAGSGHIKVYGNVLDNRSMGNAGAIRGNCYVDVYEGALFEGNYAENNGGAIEIYAGGVVEENRGTYRGNVAKGNGGAILTDGKMNLHGGIYEDNRAAKGGGLYIQSDRTGRSVDVRGVLFQNNQAEQGNDIYQSTNFAGYQGEVRISDIYLPEGVLLNISGALSGQIGVSGPVKDDKDAEILVAQGTGGYVLTQNDAEKIVASKPYETTLFKAGRMYRIHRYITIVKQPSSISEVNMGDHASLSIEAQSEEADVLTYQWYRCGDIMGNGAVKIDDAVYPVYEVPTDKAGTFYFYCIVIGEKAEGVKSSIVSVTVVNPDMAKTPVIFGHPQSKTYDVTEQIAPLTVEASAEDGGVLTYQWYKSQYADLKDAETISGANQNTYTPDSKEGDVYYYAAVTNHGPSGDKIPVTVNSDAACISVGNYEARIGDEVYTHFSEAVAGAKAGEEVKLLKDISPASSIVAASKEITVNGQGHTISRNSGNRANALFRITGGNVTMQNLTMDGGARWEGNVDDALKRGKTNSGISATNALILVENASLNVAEDVILQNNDNKNAEYRVSGGAIQITGANSRIQFAGTIKDNASAAWGGAVMQADNGQFVMEGGEVSGNQAVKNGAAFCMDHASTLTLNDGNIHNNVSSAEGGALWISKGKAILNGGKIRNNQSTSGNLVYIKDTATVEIGAVQAENPDSGQRPGVVVNGGAVTIIGQPEMDDVILLPNEKVITVNADLTGAHAINVKPQTVNQDGAKIGHADTETLARAAAQVFKVDGFACYAGYEDYENQTSDAQKTAVYYGPSVEIQMTQDLDEQIAAMEGRPLTLTVEAKIEPRKDEYTFPIYHWYSCTDKEGNNAKLLQEGEAANILKSTAHKAGTRYFYCEVTSSRYGADPVRSQVIEVHVESFYPGSLAIAKFGNILDYDLRISEIQTEDEKGANHYFHRGEGIKVSFQSTNEANLAAQRAQINQQEYELTQTGENQYETVIKGFDVHGVQDIRIEKLWMSDGRALTVQNGGSAQIEILKQAPSAEEFNYAVLEKENGQKEITVTFHLKDEEGAFQKGRISILDSDNQEIFSGEIKEAGDQLFNVPLTADISYTVEILADYDLDSNTLTQGDNEYQNVKLLSNAVSAVPGQIEFKDIESVELYRNNNGTVEKVEDIQVSDFRPEEYIAKVRMKDLPVFYAEIESGETKEDGAFWLTLKYDYAVHYEDGEKMDRAEVRFGDVSDDTASSMGFERLIETIKNNPAADISLTMDLDANDISVSSATYLGDFQGTIHGNGYTIKNLKKPLFNSLQNASIENLIVENASLSNVQGILANNADGTTLSNVHIQNSSLTTNQNEVGGFIGNAGKNTKMEQCSAANLFVSGAKYVGGFVGRIGAGSLVENCYIKGTVKATSDAVGGVIGQIDGSATLRNSYADIDFQMSVTWAVGGLVGYASGAQAVLENNISLADGETGCRVIGNTATYHSSSSNNYEIEESKLVSNANGNRIKTISKTAIDKTFLTDIMKWNDTIWSLDGASAEKMPALKNADPAYSGNQDGNSELGKKGLYIPEIERLKQLKEYDEQKEIAYHNMNKLIPFYDANYIVEYGNEIPADSLLNTQKIKHLFVYDNEGELVTGLNTDTYQNLSTLRIVYENNETQSYALTFYKKMEDIAAYHIDELGVGYTYDQYILNLENPVVQEIITKAQSLDYKEQISSVTPEAESRLYVDYYEQSVKSQIGDIVLQILESEEEYNLYLDNEIAYEKMRQDMFDNQGLEKIIYTYNYFDKWYHLKIGELSLADMIFLNVRNINADMGIKNLVDATFAQSQDNRATQNAVVFYNNVIKPVSGKNIGDFYDYFIKMFTDYTNPADWFTDNFKGILWEKPLADGVKYRAWDLLKARTELLVTILAAPQEEMYFIAVPSQVIIGSRNAYYNRTKEQLEQDIEAFAERIWNFYNISMSWITDSISRLNSKVQIQYDTRLNFKNGNQNPGTTQDPVIKWVYESLGAISADIVSAAYASGDNVFWTSGKCLTNVRVFTHETAHNQDGYYFYEGNGRRAGTGGEDHADGNIAQEDSDRYTHVFNLTRELDLGADTTENLKLSSITGKERIANYYKGVFETTYVLDYLVGQAFLRLTPQEQAKIAVKATYPQGGNYDTGGGTIEYKYMTMQDFQAMDLNDMDDLWDNGICLTDARTTKASGEYGGDNYTSVYWYQPHNDSGRPDSWTFKVLGFEMLGLRGYSDGYVTYRSGKSQNDLDALRKITGDDNITWKKYKMDRYRYVKENMDKISYFNAEDVIKAYVQALQKDARTDMGVSDRRSNINRLRQVLFGVVKRATKDFQEGSIYSDVQTEISTAQEFITAVTGDEWGDYKLIEDLDFSDVQTTGETYVAQRFLGRIDGNGHVIRGLEKPLFQNIVYAEMNNFTVETSAYGQSATALLANESKNIIINDILATNNSRNLPLVKNNKGAVVNLGANQAEDSDGIKITTAEDFLKISASDSSRKESYVLAKDIDMSSITGQRTVVSGKFTGTLNGNGYTLKNLKVPMFEDLQGAVRNVKFENADINQPSEPETALLALRASNALIDNIRVDGAKINGGLYNGAGGLVYNSAGSSYSNILIQGIELQAEFGAMYCGGLIGESGNNTIKDISISGRINMQAVCNGGLIGWIGAEEITGAYIDMDLNRVEGAATYYDGGVYAFRAIVTPNIKDTLVVGDMPEGVYKLAPDTAEGLKNLSNVYEYEGSTGNSNAQSAANIKIATEENLRDETFYTGALMWSTDIWDFSYVAAGGSPVLK